MEDLKNLLNESLNKKVNESRHGNFVITDEEPATTLSVGAFNGQEIGVIIGGVFKGGNKGAQNKAETLIKKLGLKIDRTYEEVNDDDISNDGPGLDGYPVCYFYNPAYDSVECQVFGDDPECVVAIN